MIFSVARDAGCKADGVNMEERKGEISLKAAD
jgi:hypothetical protein